MISCLWRCGPAPAVHPACYRLNMRMFISTSMGSGVMQYQEEEDRKARWKEKQLKKTKNKRKHIPRSEFDNGKTGLADAFQSYLNNIILATMEEKKEILVKEKMLNSSLPDDLLELRGLALNNLAVDTSFMQVVDGKDVQVRLVREGKMSLPAGGWRRGMLISLELEGPQGFESMDEWRKKDGMLVDIGSEWIVVSLVKLDSWVLEALTKGKRLGGVRIVKRSEEGIYRKNLKELEYLVDYPVNFKHNTPQGYIFRNIMQFVEHHNEKVKSEEKVHQEQNLVVYNKKLLTDLSKQTALAYCSLCNPVSVIHGPPGTGKTTTLAAAVLSAVANGEKVLVVAPSHAACDAFTLAVAEYWPGGRERRGKLVRLGNKLRLTSNEVEQFLPENVSQSDKLKDIEHEFDLTRSQLLEGGRGKGYLVEEEDRLVSEHNKVYWDIEEEVIEGAVVVVCTIMTASKRNIQLLMSEGHFSLVCVDEAGFTLDSQLVPVVARARRLILAGDHLQLPPVVLSQEGRVRMLNISLLERVARHCPDCVTLLSTQYRSHSVIMDWSSQHFYNGDLVAEKSNCDQLLSHILDMKKFSMQERVLAESPMLWLDSKNCSWEEQAEDEGSMSNCDEAIMVADLVSRFLLLGVKQEMIGVITPYWAQVALIRSLLWEGDGKTGVEVRTVDGYQGREKEVIVLSMVRSNSDGEVGFLSETRRINVSLTRARRCCIIIGDSGTLRRDPGLESLWRFCDQNCLIRNVEDELG